MRRRTYVDGPRGYVAGPGLGEGQGQRPSYPFLSFQAKGYRTIWTVDVSRGVVPKKKCIWKRNIYPGCTTSVCKCKMFWQFKLSVLYLGTEAVVHCPALALFCFAVQYVFSLGVHMGQIIQLLAVIIQTSVYIDM